MDERTVGTLLGAALGVLGAMIGHAIATAIQRSTGAARRPRWPYAVAIAISVAGSAAIRPYVVEQWNRATIESRADSVMAKLETTLPLFRIIREHEPALYAQMKNELIASVKLGDSQDQSIDKVRAPLTRYVAANMTLVPDDVLVSLIEVTVLEAKELSKSSPDKCVALLNGQPTGDIRPFLPDELERQGQAVMEKLVTSTKLAGRQVMTEGAAAALSLQIVLRKVDETGIPLTDFTNISSGTLQSDKACMALAEFMSGVAELPPEQAGALWRYSVATQ